jgi:hypothetical protein
MSHKKEKQEPEPKGPQKPAFDPGKTYQPKPHPQHPHESDPAEEGEDPDSGGGTPPPGPGQPGKP